MPFVKLGRNSWFIHLIPIRYTYFSMFFFRTIRELLSFVDHVTTKKLVYTYLEWSDKL